MKNKNIYISTFLTFAFVLGIVASCNKEIELSETLTPLQPASLDEDA